MARKIVDPDIFITISPYEWTSPYPDWVRSAFIKTLRSKLHLPAQETMSIVHTLLQVAKGVLAGSHGVWGNSPIPRDAQ